ncbi:MAG: hypothetical protein OHK0045_25600 [Raineya sp.]
MKKKLFFIACSLTIIGYFSSITNAQKTTTVVEPGLKAQLNGGFLCYCNEGNTCGCVKKYPAMN